MEFRAQLIEDKANGAASRLWLVLWGFREGARLAVQLCHGDTAPVEKQTILEIPAQQFVLERTSPTEPIHLVNWTYTLPQQQCVRFAVTITQASDARGYRLHISTTDYPVNLSLMTNALSVSDRSSAENLEDRDVQDSAYDPVSRRSAPSFLDHGGGAAARVAGASMGYDSSSGGQYGSSGGWSSRRAEPPFRGDFRPNKDLMESARRLAQPPEPFPAPHLLQGKLEDEGGDKPTLLLKAPPTAAAAGGQVWRINKQAGFLEDVAEAMDVAGNGDYWDCTLQIYRQSKRDDVASQGRFQALLASLYLIRDRRGHPNVLLPSIALRVEPDVYAVWPLAAEDSISLYDVIAERSRLREAQARPLFRQLVESVAFLTKSGVCHRNICLDTIVVRRDDGRLLLTGLNHALRFPTVLVNGNVPLLKPQGRVGTTSHIAPEQFANQELYGPAVDVWSCAIALFAMLTGMTPFECPDDIDPRYRVIVLERRLADVVRLLEQSMRNEQQSMRNEQTQDKSEDQGPLLSSEGVDLLQSMLTADPLKRPTAAQVLEHTWLAPNRPEEPLPLREDHEMYDDEAGRGI